MNILKKSFLPSLLFTLTVGCAPTREASSINPHTGETEEELTFLPQWFALTEKKPTFQVGQLAYIQSTRLRARTTPQLTDENVQNILYQNDQVEIISSQGEDSEFVEVQVTQSSSESSLGQHYYLPVSFLATFPVPMTEIASSAQKIFVIENIATKKSRIYRRCEGPTGCAHQLIATMDIVVGGNTPAMRTLLGTFKITNWFKFYRDHAGKYPSWYIPNFPIPAPLSDLSQWFSPSFMPNGKGELRGGFGWYTAYLGPDASAQWMHGTFGWGADKKAPIQNTASHGCTRLDNESIAYLRNQVPLGATVVRIYAEEKSSTAQPAEDGTSPAKWNYILTKLSVNSQDHDLSDREEILRKKIPSTQWLEEGTYDIDRTIVAVNGDAYSVPRNEFNGFYHIETGRFEAYKHPRSLEKGGYADLVLPDYLIQR